MDKILEKWDKILQEVKEEYEMTDVSFNTWLKPLTVSEVNNDKLYILVPLEKMARDFIEKKYMGRTHKNRCGLQLRKKRKISRKIFRKSG